MHAFSETLHPWHEFYLLVGTAAATLVGLMFVAASIGTRLFGRDHVAPMRAFISPTVVHFSSVLFVCVVAIAPSHTRLSFSLLLALGGGAGCIYTGRIWYQLFIARRFNIDVIDRTFYALIPLVGYLLLLAAGVLLFLSWGYALEIAAAALMTLLLAGIRNAWDMTVWIVIRTPGDQEQAQKTE